MNTEAIKIAADRLKNGKLVAIPTETVYGLAASAFDEKAIQNIFTTKSRPTFNPLIMHVWSEKQLLDLVEEIPAKAQSLMNAFWPGALTLVLPKKETVSDLITAGKKTVAVRMPNHPLTLTLLKQLEFPLVAPSANPFNQISPTSAEHVKKYFTSEQVFVLDGGPCRLGLESTIVGFEGAEIILYREGAIFQERIEELVGPLVLKNKNDKTPSAPGMLSKHYSPITPFYLVSDLQQAIDESEYQRIGVLSLSESYRNPRIKKTYQLSKSNNLEEAAANLYAHLHELDASNLEVIFAETMPNVGIGKSINDRLNRATAL